MFKWDFMKWDKGEYFNYECNVQNHNGGFHLVKSE